MELRQLEAVVALATELHFGRAAERLHLGQPTLSDLIRRLERELGAPLFTRTTRSVALTAAGEELLRRASTILDEVGAATVAVRRVAQGDEGTVRVGVTPPAAPVLAPCLRSAVAEHAPGIRIEVTRMWLPTLVASIGDGSIDVALTCGRVPAGEGVSDAVFCAEPLLVGLRPRHRLAVRDRVSLVDLAEDLLGTTDPQLFPAWALCERQALAEAGIDPPTCKLDGAALATPHWMDQREVDWVLLVGSLARAHDPGLVRQVDPPQLVPYTLQWAPDRARTAAVARVVQVALTAPPPDGWHTLPGHRHHAVTRGSR